MRIKTTRQFIQEMNRKGAMLTMKRTGTGEGFITYGNHGGYYESHDVNADVISAMKPALKDCGHSVYILRHKGQ